MTERIGVIGAGAFGTALAATFARAGKDVVLGARGARKVAQMQASRRNPRLPGVDLPPNLEVASLGGALQSATTVLWAVPMQALSGLLADAGPCAASQYMVACCKGVDLATGLGPTGILNGAFPDKPAAILTGPSFAADIARGLPTALTIASNRDDATRALQDQLSTPGLRLYASRDVTGAELGGALKNVVAIAAGIAMGAGLGASARAAVITRGFAEITRFAARRGAQPDTLAGLSGLGDLVLTCTSDQSRNYRFGHALGAGSGFDVATTIEGAATARAVAALAKAQGIDMPLTVMIADVLDNKHTIDEAVRLLLSRPLKEE